jgi:hypothetical protein
MGCNCRKNNMNNNEPEFRKDEIKEQNTLSKKMKTNAITIPMAKLIPIPPLLVIEETATAIMVKIKAEIGKMNFL